MLFVLSGSAQLEASLQQRTSRLPLFRSVNGDYNMLMLPKLTIPLLLLLLLPVAAFADDAASLGPTTSSPTTASGNAMGILQPANPESLQATPGAQSQSLSAPSDSSGLQQPAGTISIGEYMKGESDSAPTSEVSSSAELWLWVLATSAGSLVLLGYSYHKLAYKRLHRTYALSHKHPTRTTR
jgi:hypothetical protein